MKPLRLSALAAALVLAACTASPTTSADPAGPSFTGVNTLGSGNYSESEDGGNGLGSGNAPTEDGGNGLGSGNYAAGDTTTRGPGMLGSGN
jgi:hypothetical protein